MSQNRFGHNNTYTHTPVLGLKYLHCRSPSYTVALVGLPPRNSPRNIVADKSTHVMRNRTGVDGQNKSVSGNWGCFRLNAAWESVSAMVGAARMSRLSPPFDPAPVYHQELAGGWHISPSRFTRYLLTFLRASERPLRFFKSAPRHCKCMCVLEINNWPLFREWVFHVLFRKV